VGDPLDLPAMMEAEDQLGGIWMRQAQGHL